MFKACESYKILSTHLSHYFIIDAVSVRILGYIQRNAGSWVHR